MPSVTRISFCLLCVSGFALTHHVPVSNDLGLLISLVPDGGHDEESRLADSLEDTKKCSYSDESREAEAERVAGEYDTPCDDVGSEVFGNRYTLQNPVGGVFNEKNSNVDTGSQPSELLCVSKLSLVRFKHSATHCFL
jgi:hypothetical protein